MVNQAQTVNPRRWNSRAYTRIGLPVVIAVLFSIAVIQMWNGNTSDVKFSGTEQQGVAYLKPLTDLMDRVIAAQSTAVRGSTVDTSGLRDALTRVDDVDSTYCAALGSRQRWIDVRSRIDSRSACACPGGRVPRLHRRGPADRRSGPQDR
jgi:hypothetical protein